MGSCTYKVGLPPPLFTGRLSEAQGLREELGSTSFIQFILGNCTWSGPSWVQPLTGQEEQWGHQNVSGHHVSSPESAPPTAFLSHTAPPPLCIPAGVCMCVYLCACMCLCYTHGYLGVCAHVCLCALMHAMIATCLCVCTYCVCVRTVWIYVCACVLPVVCLLVCTYVCFCDHWRDCSVAGIREQECGQKAASFQQAQQALVGACGRETFPPGCQVAALGEQVTQCH